MIVQILFWLLVYCISTAASIVLLGDRNLISGNLFKNQAFIHLLFNWKFISAMCLAVFSRLSFILLNNSFLKVPKLANVSTTLTTFATVLSLAFIVLANYLFLNEKLNMQQAAGAAIIIIGTILMMK
ncbi:MAG: hypothetical protein C0459_10850 [Chitinophaga sp.]|jgi:drug/metabolite transporter (DMT)-like permease|nr:hypothetical protein [Chitinophaga sp.]